MIDLPRPVRVRLVYSCTSKSGGKNTYIGEFVVKHIATADYVVANCDLGTDGENWAEQCTEMWAAAEMARGKTSRTGECGKCGRVGRKLNRVTRRHAWHYLGT